MASFEPEYPVSNVGSGKNKQEIIFKKLSIQEKRVFQFFQSHYAVSQLKKGSRSTASRYKKRYDLICTKYGLDLKNQMRELAANKFSDLGYATNPPLD